MSHSGNSKLQHGDFARAKRVITFGEIAALDDSGSLHKKFKIHDDELSDLDLLTPVVLDFDAGGDSPLRNHGANLSSESKVPKSKNPKIGFRATLPPPTNAFSAFPVGRFTKPANKPLVIGGAGRVKTDLRSVSEAVFKLKLSEDMEVDSSPAGPRKKLAAIQPQERTFCAIITQDPAELSASQSISTRRKNTIGDHTCNHLLPTVRTRQSDLKCITAATVSDYYAEQNPKLCSVIKKELHQEEIDRVWIVDCRYPYEFEAGHILGAINMYHCEDLRKEFLAAPFVRSSPSKRHIVVFHCEFSSERGPNMARFMRSEDRQMNKTVYPYLAYPEIYLLEGGYKGFFESFKELCEPQFYTPMKDDMHKEALLHFKAKAKSFHDFSSLGSRSALNRY